MPTYRAPVRDMQFVIAELAGLDRVAALPGYEEATPDVAEAVLEEAAMLAGEVLAPVNKPGDEQGASLTKDGVVAADGFAAAYRRFVENGWNGLSADPEYGGQGLPGVIGAATLLLVNYLVVRFLFRHEKIDRLVEGDATVLIQKGCIVERNLAKEVLSHAELLAAAHKQGYANLDEVDGAILDPSGTICFTAKKPIPEEARHRELMARLDQLSREVASLRLGSAPPS